MIGRSRFESTTRPRPTIPLLSHRLADDREGVLADLVVGNDVVRSVEVALVDVRQRDELVDLDGVAAIDLKRFELLVLDSDVDVLLDLIALDDVGRLTSSPVSPSTFL